MTHLQILKFTLAIALVPLLCSGCAVVAVADAAVTVVATTVKIGATVVETAVNVTAAGVRAVTKSGDTETKNEDHAD